jgi:hypothetical protein
MQLAGRVQVEKVCREELTAEPERGSVRVPGVGLIELERAGSDLDIELPYVLGLVRGEHDGGRGTRRNPGIHGSESPLFILSPSADRNARVSAL